MLAGFMIGIGAIVYLSVGGIAGALLFAVGLMTVVHFQLNLFTGKAGLLTTGDIKPVKLIQIWFANLFGTFAAASLVYLSPRHIAVSEAAAAIAQVRVGNHPLLNFALGIFCGVLMYIAVTGYRETKNMVFVFVPVAAFILSGFNHCVADMFYGWFCNSEDIVRVWVGGLIPTTFGNIIGCNLIPICNKYLARLPL